MMTRKVKWHLSIGLAGCKRTDVVEIADGDDLTDEDIDEIVKDIVFNHIEWGWAEAGDDD